MPREPSWWYRAPGLTARLLSPAAQLYGMLAARRMAVGTPYRSSLPVICVGNFTAGGTGKTPATLMLAQRLIARGERPAILTRGYGGSTPGPHWVDLSGDTPATVGDEPLLLARIAPVLVARDRQAGAQAIEQRGSATVILMDDGLQNPALAKDLSIAIVDGARGLGNGYVIPAGPLRAALATQGPWIDAIVFNGVANPALIAALRGAAPAPQLNARIEASGDVAGLRGSRVVAYAGIGNPARFFDTLTALGAEVAERVPFPDHAAFTAADASRLLGLAARHDARLVTTEKDFVRLQGRPALVSLANATTALPVRLLLSERDGEHLDGLVDLALAKARR